MGMLSKSTWELQVCNCLVSRDPQTSGIFPKWVSCGVVGHILPSVKQVHILLQSGSYQHISLEGSSACYDLVDECSTLSYTFSTWKNLLGVENDSPFRTVHCEMC